jgi:hypothetical protein
VSSGVFGRSLVDSRNWIGLQQLMTAFAHSDCLCSFAAAAQSDSLCSDCSQRQPLQLLPISYQLMPAGGARGGYLGCQILVILTQTPQGAASQELD